MKNASVLFVCLLASGPAMFGQAAPAKGSIEGIVVDSKTNAPIKRVTVSLQGGAPFLRAGQPAAQNVPLTAESNALGRFTFRDLDAGTYQINCQHPRYVTMQFQSATRVSVVLGKGQALKGVMVKLTPQAVVAGRVLDEYGEAVQNAQVALLRRDTPRRYGMGGWNNAAVTQTNDLGEYRLAGVAAGSYLVRATWFNNMTMQYNTDRPLPAGPEMAYVPTHYPSASDAKTATVVNVETGAEVRGIDIRLRKAKTFRIRGSLEGLPASGNANGGGGRVMSSISLAPRGTRFDYSAGMSPVTRSADNTFEAAGVLPGAYLLVAQFNDPNAKHALAAVQPVDVTDHSIEGVVLHLAAPRDVRGTVVVEEKTPVDLGNATVRLTMQATNSGRYPQPAHIADGQFTFTEVLPVPATVEWNGPLQSYYLKEVRYGGRPIPPEGADLTTGEPLEIVLSTAMAELAGTVVDAKGKGISNAMVTLISGGVTDWPQQTQSRHGGDFSLRVKPGEYQAIAWEAMDMNLLTPEFLKHFAGSMKAVKLAAGSHEIAKLTAVSLASVQQFAGTVPPARPLASIAGTVVNAKSGEPVKNASVTLRPTGNSYFGGLMRRPRAFDNPVHAETDEHGRFSIAGVDPGVYRIVPEALGYASSTHAPYNEEDLTIVGDGQRLTDVTVKISPQGVITGKVVDEEGEPLVNSSVAASPRGAEARGAQPMGFAANVRTDDRGEYRIANLQPGSYVVRVTYQSRGGPTFTQPLPDKAEMTYSAQFYPDAVKPESAKLVDVAAGAEVTGIDVKMKRVPTVRVRGKVTGEEAGARAAMQLIPKNEHDWFSQYLQSARRGPDGEFEFSGVRPGSYYIVERGIPGSRFAIQPIEVGEKHIDGLAVELGHGRDVRAVFKVENGPGAVFINLIPVIPSLGLRPIFQNVMDGETTVTLSNVAPIAYTIGDNLRPDYYWKSIVYGGQPVTGRSIDFGTPGLLEMTVGTGAAHVNAAVVDRQGKPVPNGVVALAPASGASTAVRTGTADGQGRFNFASLAPGEYRLAAWAGTPAGDIEDAEFVRQSAGESAPVTLAPRDHKTVQVTASAAPAR